MFNLENRIPLNKGIEEKSRRADALQRAPEAEKGYVGAAPNMVLEPRTDCGGPHRLRRVRPSSRRGIGAFSRTLKGPPCERQVKQGGTTKLKSSRP